MNQSISKFRKVRLSALRPFENRMLRLLMTLMLVTLSGCLTAADHARSLHSADEREMTVGAVQREIRKGMTQTEVAEALGSPNIVTGDGDGREAWVYDKIATEASYSRSSAAAAAGGGAAGAPGDVLLLGVLVGALSSDTGASATTEKTLTVVIKFDGSKRVSSFSYHASKF